MTTKEAIERVRSRFDKWALDNEDLTALQALGLVTAESEDERIRKHIIEILNSLPGCYWYGEKDKSDCITYLEKRKESLRDFIDDFPYSDEREERKSLKVGENAYFDPNTDMWLIKKEQKPADLSEMMVHKEPYIAPVPTPMVADEQKPVEIDEEINRWMGCEAFPEGINITPLPQAMEIVERTAKHFFELGEKTVPSPGGYWEGFNAGVRECQARIRDVNDTTKEQKPVKCIDFYDEFYKRYTGPRDILAYVNMFVKKLGYVPIDIDELSACVYYVIKHKEEDTKAEQKEQKPWEWGEEETKLLDSIIDDYEAAAKSFCGYDGKIGLLRAIRDGEYNSPKPAWSEEDEKMLVSFLHKVEVCDLLTNKDYAWIIKRLKSLRSQPKQEWSEEDEAHRDFILESLEDQIRFCKKDAEGAHYAKQIRTAQNWLKSLHLQPISQPNANHTVWHNASEEKPTKLPIIHIWYHGNRVNAVVAHENISLQAELNDINFQPDDKWAYVEDLLNAQSHWKPSEEQMEAFKKYIEEFQARAEAAVGGWNNFDVMIRLYEQLKKLQS